MRLTAFMLLLIITACNNASSPLSNNSDSPINSKQSIDTPHMRDAQPVVVDVPETIYDSAFYSDLNYFDIGIQKDSLIIHYKNTVTILHDLKQLDSMIDANGDGTLNGKVVLGANNKVAYNRINDIVKLLSSDSIQNFRLHTPLEKDPG